VIVYRLAQVWLLIASPSCVTVVAPVLQLSVVVTSIVFGAGTCEAHDTVTGGGQVSIGGVLSNTVIVCAQVALLPQASVAR
jgi:hypothetical protein